MKIKYLAVMIASVFTVQEADAASNLLTTKTVKTGLTVTRSPKTAKINSGVSVTLTAQGVPVGYAAKWSGVNCANGSTCIFTMPNSATTVTVSSVKVATPPSPQPIPKYSLKVSVLPSGAGSVSGAGDYDANSRVVVTQKSNEGFAFLGWSDSNCAKLSSCRLVLNSNTNITAKFEKQLDAPTLTTPAANKINVLPNTIFSVATLKGGATYQLVLAKKGVQLSLDSTWGACTNLDATQCKQTEPQVSKTFTGFDDLLKKDGAEWQWRVRGYSNNGVAGKWSDARSFTMAGASLDISAYVEKMKNMKKVAGKATPPYQCVALARHYAINILGKDLASSSPSLIEYKEGAYSIFENSKTTSLYEKIDYKAGLTPSTGDIVFFHRSSDNAYYGHVGVVVKSDSKNIDVLEQNFCGKSDGLGLGEGKCAITVRTKLLGGGSVAGWLHIIKK